jgi:hypothetical protein
MVRSTRGNMQYLEAFIIFIYGEKVTHENPQLGKPTFGQIYIDSPFESGSVVRNVQIKQCS